MNKLTAMIHLKGYTLAEFLIKINRSRDWFYTHSISGKDYDFILLAINGLENKHDY